MNIKILVLSTALLGNASFAQSNLNRFDSSGSEMNNVTIDQVFKPNNGLTQSSILAVFNAAGIAVELPALIGVLQFYKNAGGSQPVVDYMLKRYSFRLQLLIPNPQLGTEVFVLEQKMKQAESRYSRVLKEAQQFRNVETSTLSATKAVLYNDVMERLNAEMNLSLNLRTEFEAANKTLQALKRDVLLNEVIYGDAIVAGKNLTARESAILSIKNNMKRVGIARKIHQGVSYLIFVDLSLRLVSLVSERSPTTLFPTLGLTQYGYLKMKSLLTK